MNENLTINPLTSEISYSSNHSSDCDNIINAGSQQGNLSGIHLTSCQETEKEIPECPNSVETTKHYGEVYKSGETESGLVSILNNKKIKNNKAIQNLSLNFQSDTNVLSYSYEEKTISGNPIYVPQDYILNDYNVNKTTNHENNEIDITVAGSISILNPINFTAQNINSITDESVINEAKSLSEGLEMSNSNIKRNEEKGTIDYDINFSTNARDEDLDENYYSYNVSVNEPAALYDEVMYYDCDDAEYKIKYIERGYASPKQVSISIDGGSGVLEEINSKFLSLKKQHSSETSQIITDGESSDNQGSHISKEFSSQDPSALPSVDGSTFNI